MSKIDSVQIMTERYQGYEVSISIFRVPKVNGKYILHQYQANYRDDPSKIARRFLRVHRLLTACLKQRLEPRVEK